MNPTQAKALLRERMKRQANVVPWLSTSFPQQTAFIQDPARLKAALCTRRAGKSFGVGEYACRVCHENPNSSVLIVGLTRESIKRIYIRDVLSVINRNYKLNAEFNKTELSMNFPNGSVLYLVGADSDESEMLKLLGQKFRLVIIDEASMYTNIDQHELVYAILKPAVSDYRGTIAMIGTPSNYLNSLFYDITTGAEPGWSVHKWSALDNPHVRENVLEDMTTLKQVHPGIEETPRFKQHYLGEWYVDQDALVYKYAAARNSADSLPYHNVYHYVLGVDLGYEDATAFVLGAYSFHDPNLYIVACEKKSKLLVTDVANIIRDYQARYDIGTIVIDGAAKQAVEEIKQRYALPIIATEKTHKRDFIELMNTDFRTGKIKVLPSCDALIEEWNNLVWDDKQRKAGNWVEHAGCDNHAADAALYMWRWAYNYTAQPKPVPLTEDQKLDDWWDAQGMQIEQEKELQHGSLFDF
jgi:PBSX family phage terminase large subunit